LGISHGDIILRCFALSNPVRWPHPRSHSPAARVGGEALVSRVKKPGGAL
jgi:hypothetical protein